jgi:hypothetical protein
MHSITTLEIASPIWNTNEGSAVTVKYFSQYRQRDTVTEVYNESVKHILLLDGGTDILFFNVGLHWGPAGMQDQYKARMRATMKSLKQYAMDKISLFVFWETSAHQQFNNSGGYYINGRRSRGCVPHKSDDSLFGWRERALLDAINETGLTILPIDPGGKKSPIMHPTRDKQNEIVLIPFKKFADELFDLHNGNECTHYCSTPHLWNPLWRSLRLAMDDRFGDNN